MLAYRCMNRIANLLAYYTNDDEQKHARIAVDMHGCPCMRSDYCLLVLYGMYNRFPPRAPAPALATPPAPAGFPRPYIQQACLIGYLAYIHGFGNHARYVCYVTGLQLTHVTCCADI